MPAASTPGDDPKAPGAKKAAVSKLSGPVKAMHKLGLRRDIDLALHLPMRYVDETRLTPIGDLRDGQTAQVEGRITDSRVEAHGRRQLLVRLSDDSGELLLRLLHFHPAQHKALSVGQTVRARGELRTGFFGREMVHPEFRVVAAQAPLPQTLTPVYPASAQLPQAYLRKAVTSALARAPLHEILPPDCLPDDLPPLREALQLLHHPGRGVAVEALEARSHPAWQRLKFEELLAQQLSQAQAVAQRATLAAPALQADASDLADRLKAALPFRLTAAQHRVVAEVQADIGRSIPMNRLLQGDVGSGKTVVAALAAAVAMGAGWQCALMAPTEILAEQHFRKLLQWLQPLGITVAWLTGSRKGKTRQAMMDLVGCGAAQLVVGTHAVIQSDVAFARLGLAIVDEQHRFGVAQRLALRSRRDAQRLEPHLLMMSATPIPRTLAMSYYADLDVSTIDELPPGRTPIVTKVFAMGRREQVIGRIRDAVQEGRQVYWVCPLIEDSEHIDLQNATATHAELSAALPGTGVGLLHGRMKTVEKTAVMTRFAAGELQLLVATTVIEVGVDVPNASLMVIDHAERFGLAQLHQLRGRVGRGAVASVCVLLYAAPLSPTGKARLQAMAETNDGFEIARRDLDIRGPGEFMGARQSGDAMLRFADPTSDQHLLLRAREVAPKLLSAHPGAAQAHAERWLASQADFLKA
jgi:ATP-dependent DNA helicase RecG